MDLKFFRRLNGWTGVAGSAALSLTLMGTTHAGLFGGNKDRVVSPEEASSNEAAAVQMMQRAKDAETSNPKKAIDWYDDVVDDYPRTKAAAESQYRLAQIHQLQGNAKKAFKQYQKLLQDYKDSDHFADALKQQYSIATYYMENLKPGFMGIGANIQPSELIEMFQQIKDSAPYGEYAPLCLYNVGVINAKRGSRDEAVEAFESVVIDFPNSKTAVDAQYQKIQLLKYEAGRSNDPSIQRELEETAMDFENQFANDERSDDIKAELGSLEDQRTEKNFDIARFYENKGKLQAASVYYREVLKFPGNAHYADAKARLDAIVAQDPSLAEGPRKEKPVAEAAPAPSFPTVDEAKFLGPPPPDLESDKPRMRTSPEDVRPIPAEEVPTASR